MPPAEDYAEIRRVPSEKHLRQLCQQLLNGMRLGKCRTFILHMGPCPISIPP